MRAYQSPAYTCVCLKACGSNEGCLQYNERCGQIIEEVITPARSSHWLRIMLLTGRVKQRDNRGRGAKKKKKNRQERGKNKSAPHINGSCVWLPITADAHR